jgi:hypothetical protein
MFCSLAPTQWTWRVLLSLRLYQWFFQGDVESLFLLDPLDSQSTFFSSQGKQPVNHREKPFYSMNPTQISPNYPGLIKNW